MKKLQLEIEKLIENTHGDKKIIKKIMDEKVLFPFPYENRILAYMLSIGEITYEAYARLYKEYCERNKYLELFDMAPRTFGQTWGEQHIRSLFPEFVKATKKNLKAVYPAFSGEFDLWLDGTRVEVKACRANDTSGKTNLASRAYSHSEAQEKDFKYHYQQLKPSCCDVFIFIGTCTDKLLYWVLPSEEVPKLGGFGSQHRNENTGIVNAPVFEGQLFMTEDELAPYAVSEEDILKVVRQFSTQE